MPDAPATSLMRFMHVRPVQKHDPGDTSIALLHLTVESAWIAELLSAIAEGSGLAFARTFVRSVGYVSGYDATMPWLTPVRSVAMALWDLDGEATLPGVRAAARQAAADLDLAGQSSALDGIRRALWESLYAAFIAPDEDPRDRAELIRLLRAAELLAAPATLKSLDVALAFRRARPVLPREMARRKVPSGGGPGVPALPTKVPVVSPAERLAAIRDMRVQYVALDAAARDVERQVRRVRPAERSPAVPGQASGTASTAVTAPGVLGASAIAALAPSTREVVAQAGVSLAEDRTSDVLAALAERKGALATSLQRQGGLAALSAVEAGTIDLDPADLDQVTEYEPIPWPEDFERPIEGSVGTVRPLGIGDLLILQETVLGYEMGEVAYIENVMQSESRTRVHRRLDHTETTWSTTRTTSESTERDLTSTERYDMSTEVQKTVASDLSLNVGVGVSASYGVVKVDANTDFALSSSHEESERSATDYSQEITDRSASSLTRSLTQTLTRTVINEVEETNTHGFDNTQGTAHVSGLYRFVDRRCQGQVLNYGKRLMVEFIVPEPSAFHVYGTATPPAPTVPVVEPEALPSAFSFKSITRDNYHVYARQYQVKDLAPPPAATLVIGKAIEQPSTVDELKGKDWTVTTRTDTLVVPDGYVATYCHVIGSWSYFLPDDYEMKAVVGRTFIDLEDYHEGALAEQAGEVPVAFKAKNVRAFAFTVELDCQLTNEALVAWKIETWQKVVDAYNAQKAAWDAQVTTSQMQQGNTSNAMSPDAKRDLAEGELRRGCLELLTNQHFASMDSIADGAIPYGYPELRVSTAMEEGSYMQFFEQLFEWDQVTYTLYPYFWGRKSNWVAMRQRTDSDPSFEAFLRAGAARVLVPVRPGYEEALTYYLETGEIWSGGEAPLIDDELYVSIVDELAAALDVSLDDAVPYGDAWEYTLPTSLVMLQADATLPTFTPPTA